MRNLLLIFTFLGVHMLLYTVLSAIGAIFTGSFSAVFTNPNWFFLYSILIGWWPALAVCHEIYEKDQERKKYC